MSLPTAIENLRETLNIKGLVAELIQANFFTYSFDRDFDAIYEQTSLCALPPNLWSNYESLLYNWLKPSGRLFAQFMQTGQDGGPPFHCDIVTMEKLFQPNRWRWSEQYNTDVIHSADKYEKIFLLEKVELKSDLHDLNVIPQRN